MICRVTGTLESVEGLMAVLTPPGGLSYEVMLPAYAVSGVRERVGQTASLVTFNYLESEGQGSAYIPRLIGFQTRRELEFFHLFTTVKGIGYRRALRALAEPPAVVARAIATRDAKPLTRLPEIGKRLAETIIAELHGKVDVFLSEGELKTLEAAAGGLSPAGEEAVEALVALGETRGEAQRLVAVALATAERRGKTPTNPDEIIELVYAGRGREAGRGE